MDVKSRILEKVSNGQLTVELAAELLGISRDELLDELTENERKTTREKVAREILRKIKDVKPSPKAGPRFQMTLIWDRDEGWDIKFNRGASGSGRRGRIKTLRLGKLECNAPYDKAKFNDFVAKILADPEKVNKIVARRDKWGVADSVRQLQKWVPDLEIVYKDDE